MAWLGPSFSSSSSTQTARMRTSLLRESSSLESSPVTPPADERYYSYMEAPPQTQSDQQHGRMTLTRYLDQAAQENEDLQEMTSLLLAVQMACKTIANLVNRAGLVQQQEQPGTGADHTTSGEASNFADGRYYSMQRLDQLSTAILKNALKFTGKCAVRQPRHANAQEVADHQPGLLIAKSLDSNFCACLDPLDGSGNADASICTGTVFGVFESNPNAEGGSSQNVTDESEDWTHQVLQPAKNMRAAGYCLYSSATVLVFTLGDTVQGFTLDPQMQEFVLTHRNLTIPTRGTVYSCNEANAEGWDHRYKDYLKAIKTGQGESKQRYALRYVGSMVGDIHRTLLYGGLFAYPADAINHPQGNLQLLYKTSPMAFVVHTAGGRAVDDQGRNLLEVCPTSVHAKSPCFLGSPEDIDELETYLQA
jgi:fructose-1,6-bisphosphatase I